MYLKKRRSFYAFSIFKKDFTISAICSGISNGKKWLKLDILDNEIVHKSNTNAFTSGRCVDESGEGIHPLDLLLGMEISFNENQTVGELMEPLLSRLLKLSNIARSCK